MVSSAPSHNSLISYSYLSNILSISLVQSLLGVTLYVLIPRPAAPLQFALESSTKSVSSGFILPSLIIISNISSVGFTRCILKEIYDIAHRAVSVSVSCSQEYRSAVGSMPNRYLRRRHPYWSSPSPCHRILLS